MKMREQPILMLSYWNPTSIQPSKGVFIHDQLHALCNTRSNLLFIGINVLPSRNNILKISQRNELFNSNHIITLDIYSILWKSIYITPLISYIIIKKILKREFPDFKPTIIHSNIVFPCAFVGEKFSGLFNAKHIISEHWTQVHKILKHPLFGNKSLNVYKRANAVICVSRFLVNQINETTGNNNCILVPNIVDTSLFRYKPESYKVNELNFTCIATWRIPKRLDLIIDSLVELAVYLNKKLILNVIGEGVQKEKYMKVKMPENLSINWLGYLQKKEVANVLSSSDFFLHASELETFSIVTAEALATGTPVMVSNIGALPELIDEHNGILVENTLDSWIAGLKQIVKKKYNKQEIAGRIAFKYSPESIAEKINKVYEDVFYF